MSKTQLPARHDVDSLDERLDEALTETFPASDPIAVDPPHVAGRPDSSSAGAKHPKAKRPSRTSME